jgi:hypothetical protein
MIELLEQLLTEAEFEDVFEESKLRHEMHLNAIANDVAVRKLILATWSRYGSDCNSAASLDKKIGDNFTAISNTALGSTPVTRRFIDFFFIKGRDRVEVIHRILSRYNKI